MTALLGPWEGETLRPGFAIKVGREELVMTESLYGPGQRGPDPHVHYHHSDAFYVLDGELRVELGGGEDVPAPAGTFLLVPPEVVHSFVNPGPGEARFLNLHAPGMGFEEYLRSGFQAEFDQHDPPPDGGRPASEVIVREPGAGEVLALGPSQAVVKSGGADALGSLAVLDTTIAPAFPGPVLHRHEAMLDSFYVLEGALTVQLDEERFEAGPGSYAYVPPGSAHTFSNPGERPVRFLNVIAPGGFEGYLREVAELGGPLDPATMAAIASRYDFRAI
ncbi:MAG: cupin domain-containing protein [Thermoleophilaceae bacterium]